MLKQLLSKIAIGLIVSVGSLSATNYWWVGGVGNLSDQSSGFYIHISSTDPSSATTLVNIPLNNNDNLIFNNFSGFSVGSNTITIDLSTSLNNLDLSAFNAVGQDLHIRSTNLLRVFGNINSSPNWKTFYGATPGTPSLEIRTPFPNTSDLYFENTLIQSMPISFLGAGIMNVRSAASNTLNVSNGASNSVVVQCAAPTGEVHFKCPVDLFYGDITYTDIGGTLGPVNAVYTGKVYFENSARLFALEINQAALTTSEVYFGANTITFDKSGYFKFVSNSGKLDASNATINLINQAYWNSSLPATYIDNASTVINVKSSNAQFTDIGHTFNGTVYIKAQNGVGTLNASNSIFNGNLILAGKVLSIADFNINSASGALQLIKGGKYSFYRFNAGTVTNIPTTVNLTNNAQLIATGTCIERINIHYGNFNFLSGSSVSMNYASIENATANTLQAIPVTNEDLGGNTNWTGFSSLATAGNTFVWQGAIPDKWSNPLAWNVNGSGSNGCIPMFRDSVVIPPGAHLLIDSIGAQCKTMWWQGNGTIENTLDDSTQDLRIHGSLQVDGVILINLIEMSYLEHGKLTPE